jgi:DNA-binding NarL/FixJ family response regulator
MGPSRAPDAVLSAWREDSIHPICLGLDEDSPSRSFLKVLFVDYLHADLTHSAALGATLDEQQAFVDVALGHVALNSALSFSAPDGSIASAAHARSTPKAADVVLIDQTVYDSGKVGTQIASELRHLGFTGLICMVTSGSPEVIRASLGGASIDLVLEKASSLDTMAVSIRHALQARRASSAVAAGWVDRNTPSKGPSRALPSATASGSPTSRKPLAMRAVRASSAPVAGAAAKAPSPRPLQVPSEPVPLEPNLEPAAAVGGEMLTSMVPLGTEPVARGVSGEAHAPLVDGATGLVCFGIDDEPLPRMVQEFLFIHHLHADMSRSRSLGETVCEQLAFVDIALGLVDPWTLESCGARAPADVVLLDENINPELSPEPVTGSSLARRLHERGFMGVVCILTGASQEVMDALLKLPGIDLVFAKGAAIQEMAKDIMACLQKKRPLLDDARR